MVSFLCKSLISFKWLACTSSETSTVFYFSPYLHCAYPEHAGQWMLPWKTRKRKVFHFLMLVNIYKWDMLWIFYRKGHLGQPKLWHMIVLLLPNETINLSKWNISTLLKKSTSSRHDIYFYFTSTYVTLN